MSNHERIPVSRIRIVVTLGFLVVTWLIWLWGAKGGKSDLWLSIGLLLPTLVFGFWFWGRQERRVSSTRVWAHDTVTSHPDKANIKTFLMGGIGGALALLAYHLLFPENTTSWEHFGGFHAIPLWGNTVVFIGKAIMTLHTRTEPKRSNPHYLKALHTTPAEIHADSYESCG